MIVTIRIQSDALGLIEESIQVPSETEGKTYSVLSRDEVVAAIHRDRRTAWRAVRRLAHQITRPHSKGGAAR